MRYRSWVARNRPIRKISIFRKTWWSQISLKSSSFLSLQIIRNGSPRLILIDFKLFKLSKSMELENFQNLGHLHFRWEIFMVNIRKCWYFCRMYEFYASDYFSPHSDDKNTTDTSFDCVRSCEEIEGSMEKLDVKWR